jgi:lysophospholipid acyltransferase (LPLAT)-like uncharacterized protein
MKKQVLRHCTARFSFNRRSRNYDYFAFLKSQFDVIIIAIILNIIIVYIVLKSRQNRTHARENGLGVIRKIWRGALAIAVKLFAANVKDLFV